MCKNRLFFSIYSTYHHYLCLKSTKMFFKAKINFSFLSDNVCFSSQQELATGLGVAHYMLEPVQRIPRYRLLLTGDYVIMTSLELHHHYVNITQTT